jgi:hypothetical protein
MYLNFLNRMFMKRIQLTERVLERIRRRRNVEGDEYFGSQLVFVDASLAELVPLAGFDVVDELSVFRDGFLDVVLRRSNEELDANLI